MPAAANNVFLVLAVLVFVAVLLLIEGLVGLWRTHRGATARRLQARLRALAGARDDMVETQYFKQRVLSELPALQRWLLKSRQVAALDASLLQAGMAWTVDRVLLACLVLGIAGWVGAIAFAHQRLLTGAIVAVALAVAPVVMVHVKRGKRLGRIGRQLPDALDLIARALKAGHAFSAALKMASEELAQPIAGEFRLVHDEINFGVAMQDALVHLSERVPLTDVRYFVVAVLIQRESGGNLTELLANLGRLIRERAKLLARVKVLSSEGRMSAWILGLLPFLLGGALYLANPKFMGPMFTDPLGIAMTQWLLLMMGCGMLVLRKLIRIRV
jgi:tight adherence protein B